ncbi:MAG: EpsI family protein, partial [Gammaproteobacteria bacterium]|nr:EpsI family protein [Gammaproteobacteria bacterium]
WARTPPAPDAWRPIFKQPGTELAARYGAAGETVSVYVAYYPRQLPGSELINQQNRLVDENGPWRAIGNGKRSVTAAGSNREIRQTEIRSGRRQLLVWDWYALGPFSTVNPYVGKAVQLYRQAVDRRDDGAAVFLATEIVADKATAEARLAAFMNAASEPLDAALGPR